MDNKNKVWPVVILPGWLLTPQIYTDLKTHLEKYGFTVYIADFPGFKNRKLTEVLNLTDYVKYLNKFLKKRNLNRIIFIAHSFGGRVALKLISQNPKICRALILSGTPGYPEISNIRMKMTEVTVKVGKIISFIPPLIFFRKNLRNLFYRLNRSGDYLRVTKELKQTFQRIISEQLIEYMKKIRVPTLLLWGKKDKLVSVRTARKMQRLIQGSKLIIIPDMGHMFIYKNPDIAVTKILDFLENKI